MAILEDPPLHVAVFPWLAFGHLIPYLELAKGLARRGHRVSFISTPRNIQRLPKIPPNLSSLLTFVPLPLPKLPNLPENAEATRDLHYNEIPRLKAAFDGLADPIASFLQTDTPHWIIYDFAPYWLPPIAEKLNIRRAFFSIFHASMIVFFGNPTDLLNDTDPRKCPEDFTVPPSWIPFPSNLAFRLHEILKAYDILVDEASGVTDKFRYSNCILACDVSLARACYEFDGEYMKASEQISGKPIVPVGVLPPICPGENDGDEEERSTWAPIRDWLGEKKERSVVYVAFGSEANISQEEITEMALGLELSGLPFLWVFKKSEFSLPEGFEDRVKPRGMILSGWVPQMRILSHASLGGFLTHCGWGSAVEALTTGLPMVMLPLGSEQGLVARAMEWKKVGLEIEREERKGTFTKEAVAKALREVVVDERGEVLRENARKWKGVYGDRELQDRCFDDFVRFLKDNVKCG